MKTTFAVDKTHLKEFLNPIHDDEGITHLGNLQRIAVYHRLAVVMQAYGVMCVRKLPSFDVEYNETFVQPIPYIIFRTKKNGEEKFLLFERLTGDERLASKKTLGVGGHIDTDDLNTYTSNHPGANFKSLVSSSIKREIDEEVPWLNEVANYCDPSPDAIIYSKDTPISKVHLGLVFLINVPNSFKIPDRLSSEELRMFPRWYSREELSNVEELEDWSKKFIK